MTARRLAIYWLLPFLGQFLPHPAEAQATHVKHVAPHPTGSPVRKPETQTNVRGPEPAIRASEPSAPAAQMPLAEYRITSRFGWRKHPITGKTNFHNGIDLAARAQTVRSILEGTVTATGYHRHLGKFVRIDHGAVQSIYGHLSRITVKPGQPVTAGYPLGITGRTGRATGEHLHLGIQRESTYINPWKFLQNVIEYSKNER